MKTRKEIEEHLGMEITSKDRSIPYNENGTLTFKGVNFNGVKEPNKKCYTFKVIDPPAEEALLNLVKEYISKGDYETVYAVIDVLQKESELYKKRRDAALEGIPLEKKIEYWNYCQKKENGEENKEDLSTYVSVKQRKAMERDDEER